MKEHGAGLDKALRMLDLFGSVGVRAFDITHLNLDGEKRGFRRSQSLRQAKNSMPYLIESSAKRQNNVVVRPQHLPAVLLIQPDDLAAEALEEVTPAAFLTLATSPGNHQAWVAVSAAETTDKADFARRLRKGTGADPTASGATRVAGTKNYKRKYEPDFPIVEIQSAQPGKIATQAELETMGLVAPPEPVKEAPASPLRAPLQGKRPWPSYQRCLADAPLANNSDKPDISQADFLWCLLAIDRGYSIENTSSRLMELSSKAKENGQKYAADTARNAAAVAERRRGRPR